MSERVDSLYICPWSLKDPLCQSQSLPYIRGLVSHGYRFALMTIENDAYKVPGAEIAATANGLAAEGIHWYPIARREGNSLKGKLAENISGILAGLKIYAKHRPRLVHSRSSLPLGIALGLKKLLPVRFLYDADSVLSEEYVDIGYWTRKSASFQAMSFMERAARRQADRMIVLTDTLKNDLKSRGSVSIPIDVIPCCVDTDFFSFDPAARKTRRQQLSVADDEILITYVGKIGSWYLVEETFDFFKAFAARMPRSRMLVVSPDEPEQFARLARERAIPENAVSVVRASPREVRDWLSASDVGMCLIKQLSSKRGSSPVKFGEYLSVGLPIVVSDRIGDCSRLVRQESLGLVIDHDGKVDYVALAIELLGQVSGDVVDRRLKARTAAVMEFDVNKVGVTRYLEVYRAKELGISPGDTASPMP